MQKEHPETTKTNVPAHHNQLQLLTKNRDSSHMKHNFGYGNCREAIIFMPATESQPEIVPELTSSTAKDD